MKVLTALGIAISLVAISCAAPIGIAPTSIHTMEIVSVSWSSEFLVAQKPSGLLKDEYAFRATIVEAEYLMSIGHRLAQISHSNAIDSGYIDARIVCLLYDQSRHVDTLSFGRNMIMAVNGTLYAEDTTLLWMVADKLPSYQQQALKRDRGITN
jgi:hypothetical protein